MQLFVDMDGVLADFDLGYRTAFNADASKEIDNVDWKLVTKRKGFYADLTPMPDFEELWSFVSKFNPIILTGIPFSVKEAEANKRAWVDKYIGKDQPMIACLSKDKSLHMKNKGDIIIDDWEKHKAIWIERGGRWITHINAKTSISLLKEII